MRKNVVLQQERDPDAAWAVASSLYLCSKHRLHMVTKRMATARTSCPDAGHGRQCLQLCLAA